MAILNRHSPLKSAVAAFLCVLCMFAYCPKFAMSMHIGPGEINSNEIWEFVTKFAFDYAPKQGTIVGQIKGSIKVDTRSYLVIYDDQDFSWSHIYNNESLTCDFALLPRAKGGPLVNKYTLLPQKTNMVDIKITEHVRPRLWYFAIEILIRYPTELTWVVG